MLKNNSNNTTPLHYNNSSWLTGSTAPTLELTPPMRAPPMTTTTTLPTNNDDDENLLCCEAEALLPQSLLTLSLHFRKTFNGEGTDYMFTLHTTQQNKQILGSLYPLQTMNLDCETRVPLQVSKIFPQRDDMPQVHDKIYTSGPLHKEGGCQCTMRVQRACWHR